VTVRPADDELAGLLAESARCPTRANSEAHGANARANQNIPTPEPAALMATVPATLVAMPLTAAVSPLTFRRSSTRPASLRLQRLRLGEQACNVINVITSDN
jgi:hypothetical protein